ncbi:MAG: hypothetical protein M0Q45_06705 [Bacteroidales bacterium]|jgi:hypothetical protein|nr:hypothetical protein [Bacteroidales bacterium]MCK9499178.1 hypothetical protein [Bacteroidales bacterium]MDY0314445.1 hypothetical protein [Bacteroidales bacterium]
MKNYLPKFLVFFFLILTGIAFVSCEKPEGEGGYTTVKGSVWGKKYNSAFTYLLDEYFVADEEVYIIYGNQPGYGERTRTNYLGEYSFKYLRPGNYKVYVYSKDSAFTNASGKIAIVHEFEIKKKDKLVELPQFVIFD